MGNNVEVFVKDCKALQRTFKGRLLGLMTNEAAKAVKNTPGIGRKMMTEATIPYEDLERSGLAESGVRLIISDPEKQEIHITPVIRKRPCMDMSPGHKEVEFECHRGRSYLIKKITQETKK